MFLETVKDF